MQRLDRGHGGSRSSTTIPGLSGDGLERVYIYSQCVEARRYIVGHTGPDDCLQAQQAADMLADALDGEGNIVVVEGTPGYTVSILRGNCFLDPIADAYPGISVLDSQTAEWNRERAQTVMETFLTQYGDQINGVYAIDDGMGLGVISALQGGGTCHLPRQRRRCD